MFDVSSFVENLKKKVYTESGEGKVSKTVKFRIDESKKVDKESPDFRDNIENNLLVRDEKLLTDSWNALKSTPIPSPWGYADYPTFKLKDGTILRWKEDEKLHAIYLEDDKSNAPLGLRFQVYPYKIADDRILLVYIKQDLIHFELYDLEKYVPIIKDKWETDENVLVYSNPIKTVKIARSLNTGEIEVEFPDEMKVIDEIFYISNIPTKYGEQPKYLFLCVEPKKNRIKVNSIKWFNEGKYDFGYVWIRRVARLNEKELVGEGIRMGIFLMDNDSNFIKYVIADTFYR